MAQTKFSGCPFEHIPEEEAEQIAETDELTVKLLDKRYPPPLQILRGVHPKSHGCVKATFEIDPDIHPEFQVGLFANPGKQYDAIIRFSNANVLVRPDIDEMGRHGSRGMAVKVLNVGGEVLIDDNGAHNQDFLMINQPVFAFANTEDYLRLNKILLEDNDVADRFFAPDPSVTPEQQRRIRTSLGIIGEIQRTPVAHPLGVPYFSAAPFLFGQDRVMKFSAKPRIEVPPTELPENPSDNYLREGLTETMNRNEPLYFDFLLQVRSEGDDLGIEDASSEWNENRYPFVKVATITIPAPQPEVDSEENKAHCERLAFTPWHSLQEHQPIGSINRLRQSVYQVSAEHRLEPVETLPFFIRLLEKLFKFIFG